MLLPHTFQQGLLGPIFDIILVVQFFFIFLMAMVDPTKLLSAEAYIHYMNNRFTLEREP